MASPSFSPGHCETVLLSEWFLLPLEGVVASEQPPDWAVEVQKTWELFWA